MVVPSLTGEAATWFSLNQQRLVDLAWKVFLATISLCFPVNRASVITKFNQLRQTSTVNEYEQRLSNYGLICSPYILKFLRAMLPLICTMAWSQNSWSKVTRQITFQLSIACSHGLSFKKMHFILNRCFEKIRTRQHVIVTPNAELRPTILFSSTSIFEPSVGEPKLTMGPRHPSLHSTRIQTRNTSAPQRTKQSVLSGSYVEVVAE